MSGTFDRARFAAALTTHRFGQRLIARAETASTNDDAWDALAAGAPDGTVVVADVQTQGRGRGGRAWHTPEGALAMSLLLHLGCTPDAIPTLPLVAGLALAEGLERLGVRSALKWPNDVLLGDRKLAGILCESRATASGIAAAVIGVGVNVAQREEDLPAELRDAAISLAMAGHTLAREDVAAAFLDAFEPRWTAHEEGDVRASLDAWRARAAFWGSPLTVRAPSGELRGVARDLDADGALVLETADGARVRVLAGDVA